MVALASGTTLRSVFCLTVWLLQTESHGKARAYRRGVRTHEGGAIYSVEHMERKP